MEENLKLGKTERYELIQSNKVLIKNLEKRLKAKRFIVREGDYQKQGYIRLLIQALKVQNEILKDTEIDELKKEIDEMKELIKCKSQG
jgi:hypothetical protein